MNEIERVREQAYAWEAVFEALQKASPEFYDRAPKCVDSAVLTIESFARRLEVAQRMAETLGAVVSNANGSRTSGYADIPWPTVEAARAARAEWKEIAK